MKALPELTYRTHHGIEAAVDTIVPGYIECDAAVHSGDPVIVGTRMPVSSGAWLKDYIDSPEVLADQRLDRDAVLLLVGMHVGIEWQKSRKRRGRMWKKVGDYWRQVKEQACQRLRNEYDYGDEVV